VLVGDGLYSIISTFVRRVGRLAGLNRFRSDNGRARSACRARDATAAGLCPLLVSSHRPLDRDDSARTFRGIGNALAEATRARSAILGTGATA